jgi:hypothetical protein
MRKRMASGEGGDDRRGCLVAARRPGPRHCILATAFPVGAIVGIAKGWIGGVPPVKQRGQIERGFGDVAISASTVLSSAA